jgi:hypothetical protein
MSFGTRKEVVMTKSLPSNPSLKHLRNEARELLKAHKAGESSCCAVLRNLQKFKEKPDEAIQETTVGLQEVQFALAMEYGFKNWAELKSQVAGNSQDDPHRRFWESVATVGADGREIGDAFRLAAAEMVGTPLGRAVGDIVSRGQAGEPLWQAMSAHSSEFTPVVCLLCRAAEASEKNWPATAERISKGMSSGILGPDAPHESGEQASFWGVFGLCLSSGVPILASMDTLKKSYLKSPLLKKALGDMRSAISSGEAMTETMAKHGDVFHPTVVSLIRDGERLGKLEIAACRAGEWLRDGSYETDEEFLLDDGRASAVMQMLKEGLNRGVSEVVFDPSESRVNSNGADLPTFRPKFVLSDGSQEPWKMWVLKKQIIEIERQLKAQTRLDRKQSGDTLTGALTIRIEDRERHLPVSYRSQREGTLIRIQCVEKTTAQEPLLPTEWLPLFDGTSLAKWVFDGGENMAIDGDTLVIRDDTEGKGIKAEVGGASWDNYVIRMDVMIHRLSDDSRYCVQMTGDGTCIYCQLLPGVAVLAYYDDKKGFTHIGKKDGSIPEGVWFTFQMRAEKGSVAGMINDTEVIRASCPRGTGGGFPGFLVNQQKNAEIRIRNIAIKFLEPTPEQLDEYEADASINWLRHNERFRTEGSMRVPLEDSGDAHSLSVVPAISSRVSGATKEELPLGITDEETACLLESISGQVQQIFCADDLSPAVVVSRAHDSSHPNTTFVAFMRESEDGKQFWHLMYWPDGRPYALVGQDRRAVQ